MAIDPNRRKALDMALSAIEKNYGKGAIMRLGSDEPVKDVQVIPTGAISLDIALGTGGVPRGFPAFSRVPRARHELRRQPTSYYTSTSGIGPSKPPSL